MTFNWSKNKDLLNDTAALYQFLYLSHLIKCYFGTYVLVRKPSRFKPKWIFHLFRSQMVLFFAVFAWLLTNAEGGTWEFYVGPKRVDAQFLQHANERVLFAIRKS